jgi:hypothetical protein
LVCHEHFVRLGHNKHVLEDTISSIESVTTHIGASTAGMGCTIESRLNMDYKRESRRSNATKEVLQAGIALFTASQDRVSES